jgi:urease accessory protein
VPTARATLIITEPALLRLLQLASAGLPVGGFAYSHGLEYAVEQGWLADDEAVAAWLRVQLNHGLARTDLAAIPRLYAALDQNCEADLQYWNSSLLACRETHELRLTDTAMGSALRRLLPALGVELHSSAGVPLSFVTAFARAGWQWRLSARNCALALAWSWLENQIVVTTKLMPLGQTRAQQLLAELQAEIPAALDLAWSLRDEELGAGLISLAIASSHHETQYSRLFRS